MSFLPLSITSTISIIMAISSSSRLSVYSSAPISGIKRSCLLLHDQAKSQGLLPLLLWHYHPQLPLFPAFVSLKQSSNYYFPDHLIFVLIPKTYSFAAINSGCAFYILRFFYYYHCYHYYHHFDNLLLTAQADVKPLFSKEVGYNQ